MNEMDADKTVHVTLFSRLAALPEERHRYAIRPTADL